MVAPGGARDLLGLIIEDGGATRREVKINVTPDSRDSSTAYVSEN